MKSLMIKAAKDASEVIMQNYENIGKIKFKAPRSIVTKVDILSESRIISLIAKEYPNHNILSEESGNINKNSEYTWIIDPIDGTRNFVSKIPQFSVSIALAKNREILMGIVYNPCTQEMFFAEKGKGSYLNNKKLQVSRKNRLKDSLLGFSLSNEVKFTKKTLLVLSAICNNFGALRDSGSASLNLCYVANAKLELYFTLLLNVWDIAAAKLIVEEAGGKITNIHNGKWSIDDRNIVASNGLLHNKFTGLLAKYKENENDDFGIRNSSA